MTSRLAADSARTSRLKKGGTQTMAKKPAKKATKKAAKKR